MNRIAAVCLVVLVVAGCKSGGPNPAGPTPTAQLQLSATPNPIMPSVCPATSCGPVLNQLEVLATATLRETAGVGGTVTNVAITFRRNTDNVVLAQTTSPPSPPIRWTGNGSVPIPVALHYDQAQGGAPGTLTLVVTATDDNSHAVSATLAVPVNAFSSQMNADGSGRR